MRGCLFCLGVSNYLHDLLNYGVCIRRIPNCPNLSQISCDSMSLVFRRPVENVFIILTGIVTRRVMLDF